MKILGIVGSLRRDSYNAMLMRAAADLLPPGMEKYRAQCREKGLPEDDETVVLFAMAIFLIFVGTLAQTSADVWVVVREYFRAWLAWVPFQVFFPKSFFPNLSAVPGGFYFPGGFTIGT